MTRARPTGPGFRRSHRETLLANNAADAYYAAMSGKPPQAQAYVRPKRAQPVSRSATNIDRVHSQAEIERANHPKEAAVLRAISDLLEVHPRVVCAWRQNSGAASYDAKDGKYRPIHFYSWIRRPARMRLPDIVGLMLRKDGLGLAPLAIEAKREGWTKPTDDREYEQAAYLELVRSHYGVALFATSADQVAAALA